MISTGFPHPNDIWTCVQRWHILIASVTPTLNSGRKKTPIIIACRLFYPSRNGERSLICFLAGIPWLSLLSTVIYLSLAGDKKSCNTLILPKEITGPRTTYINTCVISFVPRYKWWLSHCRVALAYDNGKLQNISVGTSYSNSRWSHCF